jgi:hypothetical protein
MQPVGTSHFQFRDHQFFRSGWGAEGGGVEDGTGGGVDSMESFLASEGIKVEQFFLIDSAFRLSMQSAEKRRNQSE